ncbi:transcriptional regulator, TetR family [Gracilibacillus ureilyticus]|uniref:Transcriptional regulator, TetR family n=1 Tax=Gracilibacillus ureilyticus TaxID=531814 RepID=A0A1H9PHA8_9BACI|nr:TetR/AcrR family transcriptional regulator [Gracilibacillus ureilyticus]SER47676.1 transcriptional regulator, TetR family [Gracilibacillus ureilyticus]
MPKSTFYNLPSEKKQILIEALQHEFSRMSLADASVASIIHYANIPRGSFYQYFKDKEDAFYYLFDQHIHMALDTFLWILKKHNGHLFDAMPDFFQVIISEKNNFRFFENALLNMNHRMENSFTNIFTDEMKSGHYKKITSIINFRELRLNENEEIIPLLKLLSIITVHAMIEKYSKDLPLNTAVNNYNKQLELVQNGVMRD